MKSFKNKILQKIEQLAKILTARKMDAHLFMHKDFEFFEECQEDLYHLNHQRIDLEWKMDDMEYEELFDVKLSLEEKAEKFSIDIVCDPLDMRIEFTSKENDNSVRVFVSEYFMENESDFNLAIRLGFPKEEVEFSEKDLINYLNEMIAYHSKFI